MPFTCVHDVVEWRDEQKEKSNKIELRIVENVEMCTSFSYHFPQMSIETASMFRLRSFLIYVPLELVVYTSFSCSIAWLYLLLRQFATLWSSRQQLKPIFLKHTDKSVFIERRICQTTQKTFFFFLFLKKETEGENKQTFMINETTLHASSLRRSHFSFIMSATNMTFAIFINALTKWNFQFHFFFFIFDESFLRNPFHIATVFFNRNNELGPQFQSIWC